MDLAGGPGPDYVDNRNGKIEAVTLDDVKRVAKRLFEGKEPIVTVVGKPKGLTPARLGFWSREPVIRGISRQAKYPEPRGLVRG